MAAATAQGSYINPMAALASQIPHALNGEYEYDMTATFKSAHISLALSLSRPDLTSRE